MEEQSTHSHQQPPPKMKRNLLLCVDAFGTLFRPRSPIAEQYGSVARGMGVQVSDDEVAKSFKSGEFFCFVLFGGF
jgi:hypothetical protein